MAGKVETSQRDDVLKRLGPAAHAVLSTRPEVLLAYLFGSVARGQASSLSDIDVGVVLEASVPPELRLGIELALESALVEASDIQTLDIRVLNQAPLLLQGAVVTDGVCVFSRDEATRVEFEASTRSKYFDYLPAARRMAAVFGEALAERLKDTRTGAGAEWPV